MSSPLGTSAQRASELISRIDDAALNASAPPAQGWLDGWLLRLSPEPARRARCIHALAQGSRPPADKLRQAQALYQAADLPLTFRVTPCTVPDLDAFLAPQGFTLEGQTTVMLHPDLASFEPPDSGSPPPARLSAPRSTQVATHGASQPTPHPAGHAVPVSPEDFIRQLGVWRKTAPAAQAVHAQRVAQAGLSMQAWFWLDLQGRIVCGAQSTTDGPLAGLHAVHTPVSARRQGRAARYLCAHALQQAARAGARQASLQVEADHHGALSLYRQLGFRDLCSDHDRQAATASRHD